jgi:hypothetical protein
VGGLPTTKALALENRRRFCNLSFMPDFSKFVEWIKLSPKHLAAIFLFTGLVLFAPERWLAFAGVVGLLRHDLAPTRAEGSGSRGQPRPRRGGTHPARICLSSGWSGGLPGISSWRSPRWIPSRIIAR